MMFVLSITPLILGITVVILSLIHKLKPQSVIDISRTNARNGRLRNNYSGDQSIPGKSVVIPSASNAENAARKFETSVNP